MEVFEYGMPVLIYYGLEMLEELHMRPRSTLDAMFISALMEVLRLELDGQEELSTNGGT